MSQRNITEKMSTKNTTMNMGTLPTKMNLNSPLSGTTSKMMTLQLPWSPDGGHDETPADGFDGLAEAAHQLYVGYMAAGLRKGKTKGFKGKDKGKGKGKHIFRTQLSVQDRVKHLAELKARSKCLRCGSTGHWAGDPACKFPSHAKKPPVKPQGSNPSLVLDILQSVMKSRLQVSMVFCMCVHVRRRNMLRSWLTGPQFQTFGQSATFTRWISRLGWFQHGQ